MLGELHGGLDVEGAAGEGGGEDAGEGEGAGELTGMDGTAVRREKTNMDMSIVYLNC